MGAGLAALLVVTRPPSPTCGDTTFGHHSYVGAAGPFASGLTSKELTMAKTPSRR